MRDRERSTKKEKRREESNWVVALARYCSDHKEPTGSVGPNKTEEGHDWLRV